MNPQWVSAAVAGIGLLGSLVWTLVNLRIENRLLKRVDTLKEWADERFIRKPEPTVIVRHHMEASL